MTSMNNLFFSPHLSKYTTDFILEQQQNKPEIRLLTSYMDERYIVINNIKSKIITHRNVFVNSFDTQKKI